MKRFLSNISKQLLSKYRDKLTVAAEARGFQSIDAMLQHQKLSIKDHIKEEKSANNPIGQGAQGGRKSLESILNMDKVKDLKSDAISEIWNSYFSKSKASLSASLSSEIWSKKLENLSKYPTFLLTIPCDESFEFYFMEFFNDSIYVTRLEDYQKNASLAKPILELHFYTDLIKRDLVLLKGDIVDSRMTLVDAQYLVYQIQYWYSTGGLKCLEILEKFHKEPSKFDYKWITEFNYFK